MMPELSSRMRKSTSLLNVVGIALGSLGIVICIAALAWLWIANARVGRLAENLFDKLDRSLLVVRQRIAQTHDRVKEAKLATDDIEASLREWTRREAGQRVAIELHAGENTQRLVSSLQQTDHWLDVSETTLGLVNEMLSIDGSTNAPAVTTMIVQLLEEIGHLRGQITEVSESAHRIQERVVKMSEEKSAEERTQQVVQITVRVVATLGSIDSRLEKTTDRLSIAQSRLQELKTRAQRRIHAVAIGITLVILLMAAGQVTLCRLAWKSFASSGVSM
jgi:uncharacterized membrane protein